MSVDQHPAPTDRQADTHDDSSEPTATATTAANGVELEFDASTSTEAKLQARVTALERALEASRSREQEIVAQYERVLDERETAGDSSDANESENGLLTRLLERWRA